MGPDNFPKLLQSNTRLNVANQIKDYIDTAVHPVIMAEDTEGKERLIPAIHQFVKKVDHDAERVYVCLIKGM